MFYAIFESHTEAFETLYYYKRFLEHLQALAVNEFKYNVQQLSGFEVQIKKTLNDIPNRQRWREAVEFDAISEEFDIDWSPVM